MEIIFSLDEIGQAAQHVLAQNPKKVILFNGDMGAGKTTFIKSLSKQLGVTDATSSPTFSLVNEYDAAEGHKVFHFDVYRLKNEGEAYDMGMDDYLYSGEWCFIEWAEKIPSLIPQQHSTIHISVLADGSRRLLLQ
ncbi:MAG: tRNA (adenosine(37)-N6)-threonylcarbamoyltransferase complex ATPase subunit type 1 TsaE [Flavobacterium sp. BFFFF1]|uniref:tRNA (adenosine(37)-N6)-threonylcarbamoyltransferase complex ATPase subunit type 1 TsaE n=1 Tax=unclassified Flavobacterium TaxID=196869 RepID=UPI000BDD83F2|nr:MULTISPECIES: tRNA (adenosine(37)-N6)-threonylcarbamoyltransferase complex ATPase subunit type 1 TsaE [unclassified Flavobacterium]OYU79622.1 MAG: tRNA (adenosine(37)-N6)-threonylcarbamoyltransferase complex ATPase subunit type 1 TsaE [Flavobacterium sp. BFFFF1]